MRPIASLWTGSTRSNETLKLFKRGAYLVNTARGKLCDRDAIARALESGQLAGYAGDVWFAQSAPKSHPWRTMLNHGMTPHISGTSLSAQARHAAGTSEILECHFEGRPIRDEYVIVDKRNLAGVGAKFYAKGNANAGRDKRLDLTFLLAKAAPWCRLDTRAAQDAKGALP